MKKSTFLVALVLLLFAGGIFATDYTVSTYTPQKEDDSLQLAHRQAAAIGAMASGTATQAVGGQIVMVTGSFTRPANTTAYAANAAVSDSTSAPTYLTLTNAARVNGGSGYITAMTLAKSGTSTTNASFRVYIYNSPPTAINDGSSFGALFANNDSLVGTADLTLITEGTASTKAYKVATGVNMPFVAATNSRNLYALIAAEAAYTPISAEQFYLKNACDQN